ncbi:M61 family metallopeptidase [Silvibacterium dinghuense]|uniref:M61 family peptidase n=1 Tax=Silvibacterium dinghuense TaxID=1560006 RepID=A0A4Q1SG23_9BACT|nr:M61 family metallopeptidase [Silvibacterium dinghuense]RXS96486.1 M61 family peptidase [Silvibacterium dinghuense]GGG91166.1 peptidase M61 [Silvibacterium dinghuense]
MHRRRFSGLCLSFLIAVPAVWAQSSTQSSSPIQVTVDVTDAPRKILHAHLVIPVQPGPLTLVYPKWIPGEHGPTGPIDNLAGLVIRAGGPEGRLLTWTRDDVNMFAFHVNVPEGTTSLDVRDDFLATAAASGFSAGASTSANLAMLSWNEILLYPAGLQASQITLAPAVKLPSDWKYGTALTKTTEADGVIHFAPVTLEQLIDSPLLTGRYFAEFPLAPEVSPKHYLDLAADGPEDLRIKPEALAAFSNLIRETGALYRSRHYESYHFLVTLSDQVAHFGLEHHQSSDDRVSEKTFLDDNLALLSADLLPHEFTHSWNGKYRRPAGLATGNYEDPMKGDLLWVYEGLTQYLGDVLAARSGIETSDEYRGALAYSAATLDARPGRTWRNLQDTATSAQILYDTSSQWDNWRRSVDYYQEGELIWLDVDTTIRRLTHDKKSLNDFCALFEGVGGNTPPKVVPYRFDDVVAALNQVAPYDWAGFLRERLNRKSSHAPLEGIEHAGYRLVYSDTPGEYIQAREAAIGDAPAWWALGIDVGSDGRIEDVLVGSVSDKAGLGPGMQIIAVNGRQYSASLLGDAITSSKGNTTPIELIVVNTGYYKVIRLDYHDGLRFPHLERIQGTPDLLDEILKPMATQPKPQ